MVGIVDGRLESEQVGGAFRSRGHEQSLPDHLSVAQGLQAHGHGADPADRVDIGFRNTDHCLDPVDGEQFRQGIVV